MGASRGGLFGSYHRRRTVAARASAVYVQWYRFNMFWRYGDGLLPFLRKDPEWPHPERAVNKGNDRHREELTDFILSN